MKRILYTLACLLLSVGTWAEDVAKIGETGYATLQSALDAATNGETVTLIADVTTGVSVSAATNAKLDFNGYKITAPSLGIQNYGTLVLMDSKGTGGIDAKYAVRVESNSNTTIKSGSYSSVEGAVTLHTSVGETVTIDGGTFSASDNAVISGNGTDRSGTPGKVVINAGIFNGGIVTSGYVACGIYSPWKDEFVVNGGTFNITNGCGILARAGSVTVNGGTFNTTGSITGKVGDSRVVVPCSAIVYDSQAGYPAQTVESNIKVPSISSASFTSEIPAVAVVGDSHIAISGGTYSSPLTEDVCADGYIPVTTPNSEGKYEAKVGTYVAQIGDKKYESLVEAITAAQNSETVTLLANTTENVTIPADKNITLDLNGKTLSGGSVASNGKKAAILNYGSVVILDSSADQTGTIKRDDPENYDQSNSYYVIDNQGSMTIKSGTITNNAGLIDSHKGSSLIRNGEVVEGAVLNIEGGTLTQKNFDVIKNGGKNSVLNITGGTIISENSYAILSYDKVNMSAGNVTGKVCFRSYTDKNEDSHGVGNITGGTINGDITVETYPGNTPNHLSECNISDDAVITGTLSVGEGNGNTFTANDEKGTIVVSGGTFTNPVSEKYCAPGFVPTANDDGTYGVKNGSYVAQIGDTKYTSLADAIAAATDAETTITLLANTTENVTIQSGKNIILDLNEKTLNGNQTTKTPTIKNQGTLTVKNGNVRRTGEGSASYYVIENEGTITMGEGLNVEGSANASLIRNNAADAKMTIDNGTYTQTGAFIVVKNDLGTVEINGGSFTTASDKNVLNNWDQMTINGGTFTGNILNGAYDTNDNKLTINDGTFNTAKISTYIGNGQTLCPIEIKGGKFTNASMTYAATGEDNAQVSVSGGTFANPVPEKYCADGFIPMENADGTYGVKTGAYVARIGEQGYETLDAAIEEAKQAESAITITLLANAETEEETLPVNVTINVDGKVLTMPKFSVIDGEAYTLPNITGAETYKVKNAYYTRTNISATEWGTVCLPFSLTSGIGTDYYTFGSISDEILTVNETTTTVAPHTPVVFNKTTNDLEINEANATVSLSKTPTLTDGALVGTYTDANISATGNIYFINGDLFHQAKVSVKVPAYRAYINNTSAGAKPGVLYINVADNANAIETVTLDDLNTAEAIYDAAGRQLSTPAKGMNIMKLANGKTVKLYIK